MQGIPGGQGVSPWSEADVVDPDLVRQGLHIDPEQSRSGRLLPPGVSGGQDEGGQDRKGAFRTTGERKGSPMRTVGSVALVADARLRELSRLRLNPPNPRLYPYPPSGFVGSYTLFSSRKPSFGSLSGF